MIIISAMYLSYIKGDFEGDTCFPAFDEAEWEVAQREDHPAFEFVVYQRRLGQTHLISNQKQGLSANGPVQSCTRPLDFVEKRCPRGPEHGSMAIQRR